MPLNEVVYLFCEGGLDAAIVRGLQGAGLDVFTTCKIADTVAALNAVLHDKNGDDIQAPINALECGVHDYLLASDTDMQRELQVRVLAERLLVPRSQTAAATTGTTSAIKWDGVSSVIHTGKENMKLSQMEGRIFGLLLADHNRTASVVGLLEYALDHKSTKQEEGAKLLRPHLVRWRN